MSFKLNPAENVLGELEKERCDILKDFKNKKILSYTAVQRLRDVDAKIKDARRGRR